MQILCSNFQARLVEQITNLGGHKTQEANVTMEGNCMFCGGPISKNARHWKSVYKATSAIWTHLGTCDQTTKCCGFGPGLLSELIMPFDQYPVLIEARMSEEGLLSFDSILEESLVRCMECVMSNRVNCFESLVANWGPECIQAQNGYMVYSAEEATKVPYNTAFNIPLLESIASGHIFDRTFAPPTEDLEQVRKDNRTCLELLAMWVSQFPEGYDNPNLQLHHSGEGLTRDFLNRPRTGEMPKGEFTRHPDLHPTAYKITDPNDIRLILPIKGILPMGCASGVVGYGMIHPNLTNAAVLQYHGLTSRNKHFDAMALAPNFDLLLTQGEATEVAKLIAAWDDCSIDVGTQRDVIVQAPFDPTMGNMQHHRDCINPLSRTSSFKNSYL